jgi:hypothetical protein
MTATLTATVDATNARVLLTVAGWTAATEAMIRRLSATDNLPVRGAEPVTLISGGAVLYDYEAPFDVAVTYRATSPQDSTTVVTSSPVTLASNGRTWLRHPGRPILNRAVVVHSRDDATRPATGRGVFPVIGRSRPIVVSQVRGSEDGTVRLLTTTAQQRTDLYALLADGSSLLLTAPPGRGWGSQYISVGDVSESRPNRIDTDEYRIISLPYTVVDRPAGPTSGGTDDTFAAVLAHYATFADVLAGETDFADLAAGVGP